MTIYTCPCCGYIEFDEFPGSYEICLICFWEDDVVQLYYPSSIGGANRVSLIEAQVNYFQFGSCEKRLIPHVRKPNIEDIKDSTWFPLYEKRIYIPDAEKSKVHVGKITSIKELCYWLRQ